MGTILKIEMLFSIVCFLPLLFLKSMFQNSEHWFCHQCRHYKAREYFSNRQFMRAQLLSRSGFGGPQPSPYPGQPPLPRCKSCLEELGDPNQHCPPTPQNRK
tara:strand:- start:10934 stop:11239 length:306 start_codon:yes stop_codon:yes gene_type:complete